MRTFLAVVLLLAGPVWVASQRGAPAVPASSTTKTCQSVMCISSRDNYLPRLDGRGGHSAAYDFNHSADVNELSGGAARKFAYEHQIQNKNPDAVLWVEWPDGNIPFQIMQPCGCISSYRESGITAREKPNSEIRYGQSKEHRDDASAYVLQGPVGSPGSSLTTRLSARLTDFTIDITFVATVLPDNRVRYSVQSKSTGLGTPLFSLPSVTERWTQFQALGPALQGSTWRTTGEPVTQSSLFVASASSEWTAVVPPGTTLREESAPISIYLNNRERVLASGVVSVYLPVRQG